MKARIYLSTDPLQPFVEYIWIYNLQEKLPIRNETKNTDIFLATTIIGSLSALKRIWDWNALIYGVSQGNR